MKSVTVYIGVGSNIQADTNIIKALPLMRRHVRLTASSTFYETIPEKSLPQTNYINGVLEAQTKLKARRLRRKLRRVERTLGRQRSRRTDSYAARPIDLDIIVYGDALIKTRKLDIPDRHIYSRAYLSLPLLELAPGLVLPDRDIPIEAVAASADAGSIRALNGVSAEIRRYINNERTEGSGAD